jgi:HTH-type transcriptional regulator, sugar sensing transcriptional regulator
MNTEVLENIGLSKNEIKVYFALLDLNQATATPIIKKAGIPHSKVYPVLEKLIAKGMASYVLRNNVKHFQASSPASLISVLNQKERQIKDQKFELKKIIPKLELNRKLTEERQEAAVYEGLEGVKTAFQLILDTSRPGSEYLVFSLGEELKSRPIRQFYRTYQLKRIKRKMKVRILANKKLREIFLKYHKYKDFNVRYSTLRLPTGIFIFGNHVMTVVWGETPTAFIITSRNNAKAYSAFFEEIWRSLG